MECDHRVRDTAMAGALGFGLLLAGFGWPWGVVGMIVGGLVGWWTVRRTGGQERGDGE